MKQETNDLIGIGIAIALTFVGLGLFLGLPYALMEHGLCLFNCN